jgi:hypothetical protein
MIKVQRIENRHRMTVVVPGPHPANRLLIYTGTAVLDEWFAVDNKLVREEVDIVLGDGSLADPLIGDDFSGNPVRMIDTSPSVWLAVIQDMGDSDNVTWAVDRLDVREEFPTGAAAPSNLVVHTSIAFQGEATGILRLGYRVDVLAATFETGTSDGTSNAVRRQDLGDAVRNAPAGISGKKK